MEQQERFAVGMIGFVLEHDVEFRVHFLANVCGLKGISRSHGWEVSVEPDNWCDLILKHRKSKSLVVAEFKLADGLANHQNPCKRLFDLPATNGRCAGYGWEIAQIAESEKWSCLRYVTIEKSASWARARNENSNLECVPVEWRQFLRAEISEESTLEADVYDCLSRFGVSIFTARRMKQMTLATQPTRPLALLKAVLAKFDVKYRTRLLGDVNDEAFGFNVYNEDFPNLERIVKPDGPIAGWFGYESSPLEGSQLSVWFYCSKSTRKNAGAKKRPKATLRKSGFKDREVHDYNSSVLVVCKAEDSTGDAE